ncbi:DUF1707 SHOCT-like domain-containing protein [Aestuariimicrobium soli]|uniref:DUF1707 SHOCT-like domain-containing protein n=1 Tax=Aestuariimicrobium soli TaxID=2035834 RepID=UPI003EB8C524
MSNLPISSKYRSQANLPVDDAERDDLVRRLNEAYSEGRIDTDEYQPLLDRVFSASTLGELLPVVEKLPVKATYLSPAIVEQGSNRPGPGELTPTRPALRAGMAVMVGGGIAALALVLAILAVIIF